MTTPRHTLTLPDGLWSTLKETAGREGRTLVSVLERAMTAYLAEQARMAQTVDSRAPQGHPHRAERAPYEVTPRIPYSKEAQTGRSPKGNREP